MGNDDYVEVEDMNDQSVDESESTPKSGTDVVNIFRDIPMGLLVVMFMILCICAIVGLQAPAFGNPSFLVNQMVLNFSLIIILSFFYGIITLITSESHPLNKYQNLFLPIIIIGVIWFKSYFTYSNNLNQFCKTKNIGADSDPNTYKQMYRPAILAWNTSKSAIAILATYLFISLFSWTMTPFFELFNSSHPLIFFFGVGFWLGCSTWAAEASTYFELQQNGCIPQEKVSFTNLSTSLKTTKEVQNTKETK